MILRALWLRPMKSQPVRSLATVLGVAIGVASVISTVLASRAAVASLSEDVEVVAGATTLEITRPGGISLNDFIHLRELSGIAHVAPVIEGTALVPELEDMVRLFGIDLLADTAVRPLELETPDEAAARELILLGTGCALSQELAAELSLKPGDALEVVINSRTHQLPIAALFAGGDVPTAFERLVVVDIATAGELLGRGSTVDRIELRPREGVTETQLQERATTLMPAGYRAASTTTRAAVRRRSTPRAVSRGSSRSAVPEPTTTASTRARRR